MTVPCSRRLVRQGVRADMKRSVQNGKGFPPLGNAQRSFTKTQRSHTWPQPNVPARTITQSVSNTQKGLGQPDDRGRRSCSLLSRCRNRRLNRDIFDSAPLASVVPTMSKNDDKKEKRDTHRCQKIQGTIVAVHRIFPNHF